MSGYFTQFKWIRGQPLAELERRIGYRERRLTSKGALIYRFLRLPQTSEFEVRGTTIWTEQRWQIEVAPRRVKELAESAAYHKNTRVPSADEVQKRNGLASMSLAGDNMLVKVYPLDRQDIGNADSYRNGSGIYQWWLAPTAGIHGKLLYILRPGESVPSGP
jgi:hypothetical protein